MFQSPAFGHAVAALLRRRDWSQRHFAILADEPQSLIVRVLRGERRPPLDRLARWLEVLQPTAGEAQELIRCALVSHGAGWIADRLSPVAAQAAEPRAVYGAAERPLRRRPRPKPSSPDRRRS